ncbi:hypothetical protein ACFRSX_18445 [Streptomyces goshikiensis]|uniref:DUF6414 family protein n=1 Tax=Streptomyces TaxID=1883 RepID=UPI00131DF634|nr:hypothetical protein [Streptomyces sp. CB02120-2]
MNKYQLAHPLYLDVQMMVSFLAYLEGGVYLSSEETVQREALKHGTPSELKLPSLGALLGLEASLNGDRIGETAETRVARHHTAASLFNGLYGFLHEDGSVIPLDSREDLASVRAGDFVKLSGRYAGNPLEEMLAVFSQLTAYMGDVTQSVEGELAQRSAKKKSGNPATRESANQQEPHPFAEVADQFHTFEKSVEMRIIRKMKEELEASPVHDVVLETSTGIKAVLTVASEYYDSSVAEKLSSGDFAVLGKVTRILREGESINLSRRTVVGKMGEEGDSFASAMTAASVFNLPSTEPLVRYPAVQILPMAIFI